ncbi:MAG TPA: M56/M15 family metallopeptidase, partial [Puia sp.]|nr:M56/M15 family metallopeptidase [Puia sp.]
MILFLYPLKVILISGLLYAYYWLFLRNRQFHRYNRLFLLLLPVMAMIIPLFNLPIPAFQGFQASTAVKMLRVGSGNWEEAVTITPNRSLFQFSSARNIATTVYIAGAMVLLVAFARALLYIRKISRQYSFELLEEVKLYQTDEQGAPFSFFNMVFWSRPLALESARGKQILRHELFHVRQNHSLDILFLEIARILFWFNPFFHALKKEVKAIHEFLADQYAFSGNNPHAYAELLLQESMKSEQASLIHPFFHNQIKRRITMITTFQNLRKSYFNRLMILPLIFVLFCAFAISVKRPNALTTSTKTITVIIDAGHGGADAGVFGISGTKEKDINLSIAKKIQTLAAEYHVNPILTRDKDVLSGNTSDYKKSLSYRANLAAQHHADLFLSIHTNGDNASSSTSGFEIYVSDQNTTLNKKSIALGSVLAAAIRKDYPISDELKKRSQGIYILKAATVPAVILECGYLTNQKDEAFISDEKNQEKIARDILEGIIQFQQDVEGNSGASVEMVPEDELSTKGASPAEAAFHDSIPAKTTSRQEIFKKVEIESDFPGGPRAWAQYLNKNLHYPDEAVNHEIQGNVVVQ